MQKSFIVTLAVAGVLFITLPASAQYADGFLTYDPGTGFVPGYTDASTALGEPSRVTPGTWGGPVDPFNPAWLSSQVVSIGEGGSLTVHFNTPIQNSPSHAFGLDFLIFGNSGFIDTSWPNGISDGSLFGNNEGATRVSVSLDGTLFYALNPLLAPTVDGLFPTDGAGNFLTPVNPALGNAAFNGQNLAGIHALYAGSAGGTGYDLSWAQDAFGQSVLLSSVSFVRVEVLSGASEIDGFAVVPEPGGLSIAALGGILLLVRRRIRSI